MEQKKKNKGMISTLFDIFGKNAQNSSELSTDKVRNVEDEIAVLTRAIKNLSEIVNYHNTAISELYLLQTEVLKYIKHDSSVEESANSFSVNKKNTNEKPN